MNMQNRKILLTEDGSHTLLNIELNEQYHSLHGAINESKHVFIESGLCRFIPSKKRLSILEIGFGTGLNAYLTLLKQQELNFKIKYTALELYPISLQEAAALNYPLLLNKVPDSLFEKLHACAWNQKMKEIIVGFEFEKIENDLLLQTFSKEFDLIYFDAFSPSKQPEMWSKNVFNKLFDCLKKGAALITYCAKGEVKRTLRTAGFDVIGLPGPIGKREITLAIKN